MRMPLTGTDKAALVDEDDYYRFMPFNWYVNENGYVVTDSSKPRRRLGVPAKVRLHRLILPLVGKNDVDHINGDKLDNRKCNLRICTRSENLSNKETQRDLPLGVYRNDYSSAPGGRRYERKKKYFVMFQLPGHPKRMKYYGAFATVEEAAGVAEKVHMELRGSYSIYSRRKVK